MLEQLYQAVLTSLQGQLAGGMLALSFIGAVFAFVRYIPMKLVPIIRRQFSISVDILGGDPAFRWFSEWLDQHPYTKKARLLTATSYSSGDNDQDNPRSILFTPAPGNHLLWYGGRPVWLNRERKEMEREGVSMGFRETITLRTWGRKPEVLRNIIEEARDYSTSMSRKVSIYVQRWDHWRKISELVGRPLDTVFLADGLLEEILDDMETFLGSKDWYVERGIAWKRGYLLYGPPGNGKSSTIAAIAEHLKLDLYTINLANRSLTDENLLSLMMDIPTTSMVLMEDIDAVVPKRDAENKNGASFAGVLNALDGVASRPGLITVMTTNYPERLDPALVRDGRVDVRVQFDNAKADQIMRMVCHFYGMDAITPDVERFAKFMEGRSMADVQGLLLRNKQDFAEAVAQCVESLPEEGGIGGEERVPAGVEAN